MITPTRPPVDKPADGEASGGVEEGTADGAASEVAELNEEGKKVMVVEADSVTVTVLVIVEETEVVKETKVLVAAGIDIVVVEGVVPRKESRKTNAAFDRTGAAFRMTSLQKPSFDA